MAVFTSRATSLDKSTFYKRVRNLPVFEKKIALRFLFQGHVVLTDFGLCKEGIEPSGTTSTFCGTPEVSSQVAMHG